MSQVLLINVSGDDRPGITVALTEVLAQYDVTILDIGQAVIHDQLAWGMLVRLHGMANDGPLYRDVLLRAHDLGLSVRFTPVSNGQYARWAGGHGRPRHVVTLLSRELSAAHLEAAARLIAGHGLNIDRIERLSGRSALERSSEERRAAIELTVRGNVDEPRAMRASLLRIGQELEVDIAIQADDIYRRNRRLVCFDMDSTLIPVEIIDEIARLAGVGEQVAAITARAMAGELDFATSFRARVRLLRGVRQSSLDALARRVALTEGAERLIGILKALGYRIAILSGGFTWFAEHLKQQLDIDYVYANELVIDNGTVTGEVAGTVVDGERKAALLRELADREGISLAQTIAVGDGANDLPMLSAAGLGVAFHAKPLVRERASHAIGTLGLDGLLYLLGVRDHELVSIVRQPL
ncbi:MAG: phosphoserine phosphatase SerB [Gammaproteobacteria bacterium]|nr:phosphoserine phosphatase SerB [Gammaproteobacteria bacterium]